MSSPRYYSSDEEIIDSSDVASNSSEESSDESSSDDESSFFTKKYNPDNPYDIPIKTKSLGKIVQVKPIPKVVKSAPKLFQYPSQETSSSSRSSAPTKTTDKNINFPSIKPSPPSKAFGKNPSLPLPSRSNTLPTMSQLNTGFKSLLPKLNLDSSIVKPLDILRSIADGDDKIYEMLFTLAKRYSSTYEDMTPLAIAVAVAMTYNKFYKNVTYDRKIEETLEELNKNLQ
jgi:hypothetical protein